MAKPQAPLVEGIMLGPEISGMAVSPPVSTTNCPGVSEITAPIEAGNISQALEKQYHFLLTFTPRSDDPGSDNSVERGADMDEITVLEYANKAKREYVSALSLTISSIAEEDPEIPTTNWNDTLSLSSDSTIESCWLSVRTALNLTKVLLSHQWNKAPPKDSTMLDLTQMLAIASREPELAMQVLYSICNDFEPAQVMVQERYQLTIALLDCLEHGRLHAHHMYHVCELMAYAPEKIDISLLDSGKMRVLLDASWRYKLSIDNIEWLTSVIAAILKQEKAQRLLFGGEETNFSHLMTFFLDTYSTAIPNAALTDPRDVNSRNQSSEDTEIMTALRIELIQIFVAIAQLQVESADFRSDLPVMISWTQGPESQIQICANVFIGTLFYSKSEMRREIIEHPELKQNLAHCLGCCQDREVLMSAFDLLNNLASDPENRLSLGKAKMLDALIYRQWQQGIDIPTRQRAFHHIRQLLKDCLPNVYELFKPERPGPENTEAGESMLHALILTFNEQGDLAIQVEVGRTIAEACRTIHGNPLSQEIQSHAQGLVEDLKAMEIRKETSENHISPSLMALAVRESFMRHPQITEPIMALIQSSNLALMTEGWLIMAFMSMWKEGAQAVYNTLCAENTFAMLKTVVQSPDPQSKTTANARYVVTKLRNQLADDPVRLAKLETLDIQQGI
ncbi:MAG: hypothetical protein Q9163_002739 [Psora crenata]